MSCAHVQSFNLLSLPVELRLQIYENLAIATSSVTIFASDGSLRITTTTIPVAILATCRLVHEEAARILGPILRELSTEIPQVAISRGNKLKSLERSPEEHCIADLVYDLVQFTWDKLRYPDRNPLLHGALLDLSETEIKTVLIFLHQTTFHLKQKLQYSPFEQGTPTSLVPHLLGLHYGLDHHARPFTSKLKRDYRFTWSWESRAGEFMEMAWAGEGLEVVVMTYRQGWPASERSIRLVGPGEGVVVMQVAVEEGNVGESV